MESITLQSMFDSVTGLTATQVCMIADLDAVEKKHLDTIREHGYTEAVLQSWDEVAEKYELSRTHRRGMSITAVGGTTTTIH